MKKTITITIGKLLFHVEEDGYLRLAAYLDSIRSRFVGYPDGEEIVGDIENRIAEHFIDGREEKDHIVTLHEVETLIASMGEPEEFADAAESPKGNAPQDRPGKKLYRNTNDALIAGVGSGLAAYFGIEPVLMRLALLVTVFVNGFGIILYIILWIVMPEAKTVTEKLEMKGAPITLGSIDRVMHEAADAVKSEPRRRKFFGSIAAFISRVFDFVFRRLGRFLVRLFGILVSIAASIGVFALTFAAAVALFNIQSPYVDFPLREAVTGPLLYTTLFAGFLSILIPFLFIIGLGSLLSGKANPKRGRWGSGLLGIWFIALIVLGVSATKIVPRYREMLANAPAYQTTVRAYDMKDFTKVDAGSGITVELREGDEFLVEAEGVERVLESLTVTTEEGMLRVRRDWRDGRLCIFCIRQGTTVIVTVPEYQEVRAAEGVRITGEDIASRNITFYLENGSRGEIELSTSTEMLAATLENGSRFEVRGAGNVARFDIQNGSHLVAEDFIAKDVAVTADNGALAEVHAITKLEAHARNGSRIRYYGLPELVSDERNGSTIRSLEREEEETE